VSGYSRHLHGRIRQNMNRGQVHLHIQKVPTRKNKEPRHHLHAEEAYRRIMKAQGSTSTFQHQGQKEQRNMYTLHRAYHSNTRGLLQEAEGMAETSHTQRRRHVQEGKQSMLAKACIHHIGYSNIGDSSKGIQAYLHLHPRPTP